MVLHLCDGLDCWQWVCEYDNAIDARRIGAVSQRGWVVRVVRKRRLRYLDRVLRLPTGSIMLKLPVGPCEERRALLGGPASSVTARPGCRSWNSLADICAAHHSRGPMRGSILVGQIMGPIVQIVIQAPNLARMFFGGYWSNLPEGPLENPRWRPFFSRWPPFSLYKIIL